MTTAESFTPRWASAPGRTVMSRMDELGLDRARFAELVNAPINVVSALINGEHAITIDMAERLAEILGASPEFWFARECQYRESLDLLESEEWIQTLPVRDMVKAGWIHARPKLASNRIQECLNFFGVESFHEWKRVFRPAIATAQYRVNERSRIVESALAAWLHQTTTMAQESDVGSFDREELVRRVPAVKALTRQRDPEVFLPALRDELRQAGVALVVLPTIPGSPVSGATRILEGGAALIAVSGRYLSDDQLWFTVFHEIGHLLLHAQGGLYLDDFSVEAASTNDDEQTANQYAGETLLPSSIRATIPAGRLIYRDVIRLAARAGVSPGVVVGQLQHDERIAITQLNRAKRRYKWIGSNLKSV